MPVSQGVACPWELECSMQGHLNKKMNTKSSTETELVGVGKYLHFNIWAANFLQEQGYKLNVNILFQDNQGAMLMEKNCCNSCTGNSWHINI